MDTLSKQQLFNACDRTGEGELNNAELIFALNGLGLYPNPSQLQNVKKKLANTQEERQGVNFHEYCSIVTNLLVTKEDPCQQGLHAVPHALRGMLLGQLEDLVSAMNDADWMQRQCKEFNHEHAEEIQKGDAFPMEPNLYAVDKCIVQSMTSADSGRRRRNALPPTITRLANPPKDDCSFSQLVNPQGIDVDFFVSHYWGHDFNQTVISLRKHAESVAGSLGKEPIDVVYWICLFALNQHRAAEEVGNSPATGPFNIALSNSKVGAAMVLDSNVHPLNRIWCLYEVHRSNDLGLPLTLVTNNGPLDDNSPPELLESISSALWKIRVINAEASKNADKFAILYEVLNKDKRDGCNHEKFLKNPHQEMGPHMDDSWFNRFDSKVIRLISNTLFSNAMKNCNTEKAIEAIGYGATHSVDDLKRIQELGGDLNQPVDTRFESGKAYLVHVAAFFNLSDQMSYLLSQGANMYAKTNHIGDPPITIAAIEGHCDAARTLLDHGCDVDTLDGEGCTPIFVAAQFARHKMVSLLLEYKANINALSPDLETALHIAISQNNDLEIVKQLVTAKVDIYRKDSDGNTALDLANFLEDRSVIAEFLEQQMQSRKGC